MRTADCGAIVAIEAQTFKTRFDRERLLNLMKMPVFCGFVDDLDEPSKLAAYLLATVIIDEAEILSIAVNLEHQKGKRGAGLLMHFLTYVAKQNVKTVLLEVAADNLPALTLYHRHGFVEFGRRIAYYKRPVGNCDAIMMRRICG